MEKIEASLYDHECLVVGPFMAQSDDLGEQVKFEFESLNEIRSTVDMVRRHMVGY
jgi:hypothetical protein